MITLSVVMVALPQACVFAASPQVALSAQHPAVVESRQTLMLAPASSLSDDRAMLAAAVMSHTVAGTVVYRVTATGSMRPLFDGNAVLLAEPASFDSLQIGDIVTFMHPRRQEVIVHRILEKRRNGFWTKGDHNAAMDDVLVTRENYLERVYAIIYTQRGVPTAKPVDSLLKTPRLAGADTVAR